MLDSSKFTYVVREDTWNEDRFDVFREHTGQAFHIENFRNRAVAEALATLLPKLHLFDHHSAQREIARRTESEPAE